MRRVLPSCLIACVIAGTTMCSIAHAAAVALTPATFPIERHVLPNGLVVLTHEDHAVPSLTLWQWYRTGSRLEHPGITGISHFLEHMMFNGSPHVAPREFDAQLESHGGSANAFTERDYTSYYEDISPSQLDVILQLDADRMSGLSLLPEQIAKERAIVQEERRGRVDNDADGQLDEKLWETAFTVAPSRWPVLGSMADITRLTRDDMETYFADHYGPNNCILVLTGAFDTAEALRHIERAFGHVPSRPLAAETVVGEPPQARERHVHVRYPGDAVSVRLGYRAPSARDADAPAAEMLAAILGGTSAARLPQVLVRNRGLALDAGADFDGHLDPSLFEITLGLAPHVSAARGVAAVDSVVTQLTRQGPTPRELRTAAAQLALGLLQSLTTNNAAGEQIARAEHIGGDFHRLYDAIPRWNAVTAEDVRRVACEILVPAHRTVAELVPAAGTAPPRVTRTAR